MEVFQLMQQYGHEQVVFCHDRTSGLKAIIAIHDTTLGPALGGTRMWPYASEEEALRDVLRLSRGMTYKAAAMGLNLGGGKAVIWGNPKTDKTEELLRAYGRFIQTLHGRYITAEDVGTTVEDMNIILQETDYVAGRADVSGDPSPVTAFGVYRGMKACARWVWQSETLRGRTVAVQGLGKVGYHLCRHLADEGARLVVTDIAPESVERAVRDFGATPVAPEAIYDVECDIYAPCALGATLNDQTIPRLKCRIVAGSANNQLAEPRHARMLEDRGILYAPDYVINGGGLINVAHEFHPGGYNRDRAYAQVATIYDKLLRIFHIAQERGITTAEAADVLAEERLRKLHDLKRIYTAR